MSIYALLQIALFLAVLMLLIKPLGWYMARVYEGTPCGLGWAVGWLERLIYRLCGINPSEEMTWQTYAKAMLLFNLLGFVVVYALQRMQGFLPLNPRNMTAVSPDLAANTAVSFVTNTNWQSYSGETTLSYLTQMLGLTVQNFVSAATGMAILVALIRGFARRSSQTIGNFWYDLTRSVLYVLLPLSIVGALVLVSQGVGADVPAVSVGRANPTNDGHRWKSRDGTEYCGGAGCFTGDHQAVGHQRRWILQRQLGASVGEPDAAEQFHRDALDSADRRCLVLHIWANGWRHPPRLGGACCHDSSFRAVVARGILG